MKRIIFFAVFAAFAMQGFAQKFSTKTGKISFYSKAPMEDITAVNNQVTGLMDPATGNLAFIVLIKSFEFDKALMQEHFNENYMHSDKHPKSTFDGKITNISAVNLSKDGTYTAEVEGKLTIHGVTKDVKETGKITVKGNTATLNSKFNVALKDYGIKNDKIQNIAETMEVTVAVVMSK